MLTDAAKTAHLAAVRTFECGAAAATFEELGTLFPPAHFERLLQDGFQFYRTTFWLPFGRGPQNVFERIVEDLKPKAEPGTAVIGVEWWFSVLSTNSTPQWLLPCHFDRNDLQETNLGKLKYPEKGSVLFLNGVPYGELVVTDQVQTVRGIEPKQPKEMLFVEPASNRYVVFPGHLYHGVIGRMWRALEPASLRVSMAVNWWREKPKAAYLHDSRQAPEIFRLAR